LNLIDTSVWIEFFRHADRAGQLASMLADDVVLLHPWVYGELLLGGIDSSASGVARDLAQLPPAPVVDDDEMLSFITARAISGHGIGWVDAQLLASALVAGARLWTFDRKLAAVAGELAIEPLPVQ
jgi:predicted nucleic acid-binding protein